MDAKLSRQKRDAALEHAIAAAQLLVFEVDDPRGFDPPGHDAAKWSAKVLAWRQQMLELLDTIQVGEPWKSLVASSTLTPLLGRQDLLHLRMLQWRIRGTGDEHLDNDDGRLVRLSTRFVTCADIVIDWAEKEGRDGIPSDKLHVLNMFQAELCDSLVVVESMGNEIKASVDRIRARVDADGKVFFPQPADTWNVAWELFTVGWQIAEHLKLSISSYPPIFRFCALSEAVPARERFNKTGRIVCPSCHSNVEPLTAENRRRGSLQSAGWQCQTCAVMGFFPVSVQKDSYWYQPPRRHLRRLPRSRSLPGLHSPT
jgi:hypothetical protein